MSHKSLLKFVFPLVGLAFLFIFALFSACSPQGRARDYEHPAHFDTVFSRTENIAQSDAPAANAYLENAYATFPNAGKMDLYRKYNYFHWQYSRYNHSLPLALAYADSMINVFDDPAFSEHYPVQHVRAFFSKVDVLREMKRYNEAYVYLYKGREIMLPLHDTCLYHEFSNKLGLVYYRQGKYQEAASYFAEAVEQLNSCDTSSFTIFYTQQGILDNTALSYENAGDNKQALFYYDSTLRFISQHGAKFSADKEHYADILAAIAVVEGNKGGILLRMGDTLGAEILLKRSIEINNAGKNEKLDAQIKMVVLTDMYLAGDRLVEAQAMLQEIEAAFKITSKPYIRQRWHYLQWQYYEKTGQRGPGYIALKSYLSLRDSAEAASVKPSIADVQDELEHIEGEHRLALLQKGNELKSMYMWILIFLIAAAIFIAWQIWRNWLKSRRHIKELELLNAKINTQHEHISRSLTALEKSQQSHYRMMKTVAHDLRNPVGAIHTMADLMLMDIERGGGANKREWPELIKTSSANALSLISDLLVLDTSVVNLEKELMELHVTLKYCVDLMQTKAAEKQQRIVLKAEPAKVMASREKIWRVFSNLLNNAIKFSPDNSIIEVVMKRLNGFVQIYVKDRGIGIPPELQGLIFNDTAQAKRKGTRGEASFGFGLSISRQIIEAHEGRIWFETEEGRGTTFYIEMNASG